LSSAAPQARQAHPRGGALCLLLLTQKQAAAFRSNWLRAKKSIEL